jgi:UDP-perosamine 4-acetyltransferase
MTPSVPVLMPRLNANDDSGIIVQWFKDAGQAVARGELIVQVETTKVSVDIEAEADGFLFPLVAAGASIEVGAPIARIAASQDVGDLQKVDPIAANSATTGRLASRKALELIAQAGIDVAEIPGTGPIARQDVERFLAARSFTAALVELAERLPIDTTSTVLYGAGDQGVVVLDCLRAGSTFAPLCFIDDRPASPTLDGLPVFASNALAALRRRGVRYAHVCIGSPLPKLRVAEKLKSEGFEIINAVHPRATVSPSAVLGEGVYVGPGVIVGPFANIGSFSQVNNNATIPHHVRVGIAVQISDGANIAGGVTVGDRSLLGLGVTVNNGCDIGADVTVVSGVSVFAPVRDSEIVRGPMMKRRAASPRTDRQ